MLDNISVFAELPATPLQQTKYYTQIVRQHILLNGRRQVNYILRKMLSIRIRMIFPISFECVHRTIVRHELIDAITDVSHEAIHQ